MVAPSIFVLVPLYVYPSSGAWQPMFNSIANHSGVRFKVIINPANGPGTTTYPDSNYISSLAQLNTYPNVDILGYTYTSWANRSASSIQHDIATYASWPTYHAANITLNGIFFDESPTNTSKLPYMRQLAAYTKSIMPAKTGNHVVFNTGTTTDADFYAFADTVNAFEGPAPTSSSSSSSEAVLAAIPQAQYAASSMILYDYAQDTSSLAADVNTLMDAGVAGMFFTTQPDGFRTYSNQWGSFLDAVDAYLVAAATSSASSGSSTSSASSAGSASSGVSTTAFSAVTTVTSTSLSTATVTRTASWTKGKTTTTANAKMKAVLAEI